MIFIPPFLTVSMVFFRRKTRARRGKTLTSAELLSHNTGFEFCFICFIESFPPVGNVSL
jgi:hypothetical protein